jgi:predicted membrane-bound spermidine synthase
MIGDAVLYAASRATHSALDNVSRRLTWTAISGAFLFAAMVLAIIAAYMVAEPRFGPLAAIGIIAGGCVIAGLISMSVPVIIEKIEARRRNKGSAMSTAVAAVDEEAKQAVDYFGALQVVGTAFLFGLGAARRLRR